MLRFAPSPTGDMHIGNLRVAIFNHILSKQLNEELLIRIEDTDKQRNIEGKDKEILQILDLFSIDYQKVVYQSENLKYHTKMGMKLLFDKKAFNCFCSDEALQKDRQKAKQEKKPYRYVGGCDKLSDDAVLNVDAPFSVRIKKPEHNIKFTDLIKGEFSFEPFDVDSFVILRQDKTPTYNFACAIDDMLYDISTVIRGEDHLSNTPKQIHIRESLGYDKKINYIHLPLILNMQTGKKMSKRDDASSVKWLIDQGYLPIAIANYLVSLGYNSPKEIFTLEEAIQWFDIKKISKASPKFDINQLNHINKEHIKLLDDLRLSKLIGYADEDIGKLGKLYLEESYTIKQIKEKIDLIFKQKEILDEFENEFTSIQNTIQTLPFIDSFDEFKKAIMQETQLKGKKLFMPLRYILTGNKHGPNLSEIYPYIKNYIKEIAR